MPGSAGVINARVTTSPTPASISKQLLNIVAQGFRFHARRLLLDQQIE
jgi:hypothetical protein